MQKSKGKHSLEYWESLEKKGSNNKRLMTYEEYKRAKVVGKGKAVLEGGLRRVGNVVIGAGKSAFENAQKEQGKKKRGRGPAAEDYLRVASGF